MKRTMRTALCIVLLSLSAASQANLNRDPKMVKIVTSDIDNFWRAYDLAKNESDKSKRASIFQSEYLDKGSAGLKDFLALRIKSAEALVTTIDRMPKYYASIRPQTLKVKTMHKRMRSAFIKFKKLYPEAVFPDVYFLIGITSSGGTTGASGLLIGTEMYGKTPTTPQEELLPWLRSVLSSVEFVPGIVAHESCHYNQRLGTGRTLLAKSLQEGSCDLIGELISGQNINEKLKAYGKTHGDEIWRDFKADMDKPDYSKWIYNGPTSKDRPGDLGYYVGYTIANWYYRRAKDKRQAVKDILTIQDFNAFLETSGYNGPAS